MSLSTGRCPNECWAVSARFKTFSRAGSPETFRRIAIHALPSPSQTRISNAVACFFSAGVDSFYTLLKHSDEVTTLLLVHGFDIGLENEAMSAKVSATVRRIAARLNKKVIEIHTNVRAFSASRLRWGMYHGSGGARSRRFDVRAPGFENLHPGDTYVCRPSAMGAHTRSSIHSGVQSKSDLSMMAAKRRASKKWLPSPNQTSP